VTFLLEFCTFYRLATIRIKTCIIRFIQNEVKQGFTLIIQ